MLDGVESSYVDILDPTHLEFEYLRHTVQVIDAVHPIKAPLGLFQIGGGPCALARYLAATRRSVHSTVVERDAAIFDLATRQMGLVASSRLALRVGDGREVLAVEADDSIDVLMIDAFEGVVVPQHMVSVEFVAVARRVMRPGGTHLINLIDTAPLELTRAVAATMGASYRHTVLLTDLAVIQHRSPGNVLIVGSDAPIPVELISRACRRDRTPWEARSGRALARMIGERPPIRDGQPADHHATLRDPRWGTGRRMGSDE